MVDKSVTPTGEPLTRFLKCRSSAPLIGAFFDGSRAICADSVGYQLFQIRQMRCKAPRRSVFAASGSSSRCADRGQVGVAFVMARYLVIGVDHR